MVPVLSGDCCDRLHVCWSAPIGPWDLSISAGPPGAAPLHLGARLSHTGGLAACVGAHLPRARQVVAGIPVLACGGSRASPRNRKTPQASKDIYDSPRVSKRVAGQVRSAKDPSLCLTMGGIDNTLVKQGFERKNGYLTLRRAPKRPRRSSWSSSGSTASTT